MISYLQYNHVLQSNALNDLCRIAKLLDNQPAVPLSSYVQNVRMGLLGRHWSHVALAYDDETPVGYKLGRSDDPRCFESWRGGVHPDYRRQGIAMELAALQEKWCQEQGFTSIMTRTDPNNAAMLILNLKRGFTISGTVLVRGINMNVVLHKSLSPTAQGNTETT